MTKSFREICGQGNTGNNTTILNEQKANRSLSGYTERLYFECFMAIVDEKTFKL